jgi:hypothetical protein
VQPRAKQDQKTSIDESKTTYDFTPTERMFFAGQIQQINAVQAAAQNAVALVVEQQGLKGTWRIRQEGSADCLSKDTFATKRSSFAFSSRR